MIEWKISELMERYKQIRQKLKEDKSVLMTKDMFHTVSKTPSCTEGQPQIPSQYYGSQDH